MLKLSDIKQMVETDMKIDPTTLDRESLNIPQLHNKYLCIMIDEKLILKKQESDLAILRKNKWLYYLGKMSEEQLNNLILPSHILFLYAGVNLKFGTVNVKNELISFAIDFSQSIFILTESSSFMVIIDLE